MTEKIGINPDHFEIDGNLIGPSIGEINNISPFTPTHYTLSVTSQTIDGDLVNVLKVSPSW